MVVVKYWFQIIGNKLGRLALWVMLLGLGFSAAAEPISLAEQLVGLRSYSADFSQTVLGGRNEILQQSSGRVQIARPDRFKWVVAEPYPQTLVTVADKLYLYDPDLEQLTVESLAEAMAGTPALILTGNSDQIDELFRVAARQGPAREDEGATPSVQYSLYPKDESALFAEIRLRFDSDRVLSQLDIVDHLGQLTQVNFANVSYNGQMSADEFEFTVPAGTDVIGELHQP